MQPNHMQREGDRERGERGTERERDRETDSPPTATDVGVILAYFEFAWTFSWG
jgi:hypothetical protein